MLKWVVGVIAVVIAFVAGPRVALQGEVDKRLELPELSHLSRWLAEKESRFSDITEGAEKTILWAEPAAPAKTDYAVVYLHGFSATRQELSPVTEQFAQDLGANLYLSRLSGHGRGSEPMGQSSADDWLNDAWQAWRIGESLGEKVIVVATSTGATLATWLAQQPEVQDKLAGLVLISPNFGPKDTRAELLLTPWAKLWVPKLLGSEHSWEPVSDLAEKYWTSRYSVNALFEMQALVKYVRELGGEQVTAPTLFAYSYADQTVSPEQIDAMYQRWGAPHKQRVIVEDEPEQSPHVLAGDILSPGRTDEFVALLQRFALQLDAS